MRVEAHGLQQRAWREWRPAWSDLLAQSTADRLFLDWDWLELWWKHFGARAGEEAYLCTAHNGETLVGALPVVAGAVRRRPGIAMLSVQVMGMRHYDARNILSEYLDVVALPGREDAARAAIVRFIQHHFHPGEFVVGWTRTPQEWARCLAGPGRHVRTMSRERGYQADLRQGFQAYAGSLGASTRRSLLNQRQRLEAGGPVQLAYAGEQELADAIGEMNRLHAGRWGSPAFRGHVLAFHLELLARWAPLGRVAMSRLMVGRRCVSSLYDLRIGTRQYNIQLGFDSRFVPKVSLGLLHFGYAMESAANAGVLTYDFLVGRGKKSDYKNALASQRNDVATVQALSHPLAAPLYRVIDALRSLRG